MAEKREKRKQTRISLLPELRGGVYANSMLVVYTREEFILDFVMRARPIPTVTGRVIISPSHLKRIIATLQTKVEEYEEKFGKLKAAKAPPKYGFVLRRGR